MVYELYLLLFSAYAGFASSLRGGYLVGVFVVDVSSFTGSVMALIALLMLLVSLVGLGFAFLHYLLTWGGDFEAIYLLGRSRVLVLEYLLLFLFVSTLYGFLLGTAVSSVLSLVLTRFLGYLGLMPVLPGVLDIIGAVYRSLWLWASTYVMLSLLGSWWVFRYVVS